ncbi:YrhB domain-containing protein [Flavobacterium sp.]|uniref:YrhB domain-containing protein n=1 Tax=Flavobacterium sp. TaxID=239 RepID=UPI004047E3D1
MLTEQAMKEVAEHYIAFMSNNIALTIYYSATIQKSYGNVYFFNSKKHAETGDFGYSIVRGPFLVEKKSGRIVNFGTAYPLEFYLEEYEKSTLVPSLDRYWYPETESYSHK